LYYQEQLRGYPLKASELSLEDRGSIALEIYDGDTWRDITKPEAKEIQLKPLNDQYFQDSSPSINYQRYYLKMDNSAGTSSETPRRIGSGKAVKRTKPSVARRRTTAGPKPQARLGVEEGLDGLNMEETPQTSSSNSSAAPSPPPPSHLEEEVSVEDFEEPALASGSSAASRKTMQV